MPSISLFVIIPENTEPDKGNESNQRIFISDASPDLHEKLENANENNEFPILVNGVFDLVVDDPKAIRREAQKTDAQTENFVSLHSFLSGWPCDAVRFKW